MKINSALSSFKVTDFGTSRKSICDPHRKKLNYNKGDYDSLRTYVNCDWNKEFAGDNLDVETIWNILKNKIDNGVKRYVPLTAGFYNFKWKRPLSEEIRSEIRRKKSLWRKYIRDKNTASWFQYKVQRNKVKRIIKTNVKEEQNAIAQHYKSNPKKFWKYVNSKTKRTERIGDLKVINDHGCLLYTSPSPRDGLLSRMPSSA